MLTHSRALPRRLLVAATGLAVAAASLTALSSPASADPTTVTVVGTSDVYDSNLIQSVIAPDFQAKYPQYTLNYVSKGTGAAITYAEAGTADALIVHAPSLENQFVSQGYSLEPSGRAIFWGDYILAGGTSDPAGVGANASHDIVQAYEDIAAEGTKTDANGNPLANFVSRGGLPGTTVQEHQIWALTTGVPTCIVSAANGGGASPSTTDIGSACPTDISYPAWYHVTGLTQGPNIEAANTCNYPGATTNNCYVFTDRGTFQYLQSGGSQTSPTTPPANLTPLTSNNSPTATGGHTLLVNSFHAYAVNPQKVGTTLNTAGATALLDWITSPAGQSAIGAYLNGTNDPPFIPDAAPKVAVNKPPSVISPRRTLTFAGSLENAVPGTPALSGIPVQLFGTPSATPKATPTQVGTATTDSNGGFSIQYHPQVDMTYTLATQAFQMIEYPNLSPQFTDELQPTTTSLGTVDIQGAIQNLKTTKSHVHITVRGTVSPTPSGGTAFLTLYVRPAGSTKAFAYHGRHKLSDGRGSFSVSYYLPKGTWNYYVKYANPNTILSVASATHTVKVD